MKQYRVLWDYTSGYGGPWEAGDVISLDDALAEAINRDSPGVLSLLGVADDAAPIAPPADRQMKRRKDRGDASPIDKTTFKAVKEK